MIRLCWSQESILNSACFFFIGLICVWLLLSLYSVCFRLFTQSSWSALCIFPAGALLKTAKCFPRLASRNQAMCTPCIMAHMWTTQKTSSPTASRRPRTECWAKACTWAATSRRPNATRSEPTSATASCSSWRLTSAEWKRSTATITHCARPGTTTDTTAHGCLRTARSQRSNLAERKTVCGTRNASLWSMWRVAWMRGSGARCVISSAVTCAAAQSVRHADRHLQMYRMRFGTAGHAGTGSVLLKTSMCVWRGHRTSLTLGHFTNIHIHIHIQSCRASTAR